MKIYRQLWRVKFGNPSSCCYMSFSVRPEQNTCNIIALQYWSALLHWKIARARLEAASSTEMRLLEWVARVANHSLVMNI